MLLEGQEIHCSPKWRQNCRHVRILAAKLAGGEVQGGENLRSILCKRPLEALGQSNIILTTGRLFFFGGAFLLLVTFNKLHGSGSMQSSEILLLCSSFCSQAISPKALLSVTSSSKGTRGPCSRSCRIFLPENLESNLWAAWSYKSIKLALVKCCHSKVDF